MFKKVIVGISGGVDSAIAAFLLKNKGFNVTGVFMKNWDIADETGKCRTEEDYEYAQWACDKLKIPLLQVNFVKEYWNNVFSYLIEKYENGHTPNPDILCNKTIKFDKFYRFACSELRADAIATGHYVRTSFGPYLEQFKPDTNVQLLMAQDNMKDQTFFLSQVPQDALRYSMFPLGEYLKTDVKKIAREVGLDLLVNKKESMGICFVGKRNFQDFISEYIADKPGDFVDLMTGKIIGKHTGFHHWTVGQRSKVLVASDAYFVYRKDIDTNNILLVPGTNHPALYSDLITTETPHWISAEPPELSEHFSTLYCSFRFQHQDPLVPCTVYRAAQDRLIIKVSQPLRAVTEGQFVVFYKNEECLGSAPVLYPGPSYYSLNQEVNREHWRKYGNNEKQSAHASI